MSIINLLPPNCSITRGEIFFEKQNLSSLSQKQMSKIRGSKIALIPQDPMTSLNPLYTIENQLLENILQHRQCSKTDAKNIALQSLDMVQIPNAKDRLKNYPHELSGGMKQRIIIAMALSTKAKIIIADEPTTALDVTVQAQILHLLKQLQKELNTSIILITHDLGVVKENADEINIMYSGHIIEKANCKTLFNSPKHPYTQALLKAIPTQYTQKLENIKGMPPKLGEKILGCSFNPRCNKTLDICMQTIPQLQDLEDKSCVACHLFK